jgi:iron complex transport system substrate-binding protein
MLGRGADIVAVSRGLKRDVLLNRICPEIGKAAVPQAQGAINIEELARMRPGVVFVSGVIGRHPAETEKLLAFGFPYLVVDYHTIPGQLRTIEMIGTAIGAKNRAGEYINYYRSCIQRVQPVVQRIPPEDRVRLYHATVEPTRTYGKDSLPADWLRLVGAANVALEESLAAREGEQHASIEQILFWNPEVILVNEPGVAKRILQDRQWSTLAAVKTKRVYQLPIGISRWGHPGSLETPLAVLWTAKTVYPQYFASIDIRQETTDFYRRFFNLELTDELYARIMRGQGMRKPKRN